MQNTSTFKFIRSTSEPRTMGRMSELLMLQQLATCFYSAIKSNQVARVTTTSLWQENIGTYLKGTSSPSLKSRLESRRTDKRAKTRHNLSTEIRRLLGSISILVTLQPISYKPTSTCKNQELHISAQKLLLINTSSLPSIPSPISHQGGIRMSLESKCSCSE